MHALALSSWFARIGPGDWVDAACIVAAVALMIVGGRRGISGHLSRLLGLLGAVAAGFWLFRPVAGALAHVSGADAHPWVPPLVAFVLVFALALVLFILLRRVAQRFFELVVQQPLDGILGVLAGAAHAVLALVVAFAVAVLLPAGTLRKAMCEQSRVGRRLVPPIERRISASSIEKAKSAARRTAARVAGSHRTAAAAAAQRAAAAHAAAARPAAPAARPATTIATISKPPATPAPARRDATNPPPRKATAR
jgi:uncharacterized membrane protein required for colicin V production